MKNVWNDPDGNIESEVRGKSFYFNNFLKNGVLDSIIDSQDLSDVDFDKMAYYLTDKGYTVFTKKAWPIDLTDKRRSYFILLDNFNYNDQLNSKKVATVVSLSKKLYVESSWFFRSFIGFEGDKRFDQKISRRCRVNQLNYVDAGDFAILYKIVAKDILAETTENKGYVDLDNHSVSTIVLSS